MKKSFCKKSDISKGLLVISLPMKSFFENILAADLFFYSFFQTNEFSYFENEIVTSRI